MTTLYKLTDSNGRTRPGEANECQWGPSVTYRARAKSGGLCSSQYIHAYLDPHLAMLLNPIHAGIRNPRLWVAEGRIAARDHQLKVGCKSLTTVREIPTPAITIKQRVTFAILCAKAVCTNTAWNAWADGWLSGADRSLAAAWSAAELAAWARSAWSAESAELAARSAAWAAEAAAEAAAESAARSAANIDLLAIVVLVFPESQP